MSQIALRKVDVNSLIALFNRSLIVSSVLDFTLSSERIHSIVQNEQNSFFKEWETPTTGIFESEPFEEIKILIYSGSQFVSKILGLFRKAKDVQIVITLDDNRTPTSIEISESENDLKISVPTTQTMLAAETLNAEEHGMMFETKSAITSFVLPQETLADINNLKALSYSAAPKPVTSVTFKGSEGRIVAFDGTFSRTIVRGYEGADFEVKINKALLSLINSEDHTVYLCPTKTEEQEFERFVFVSKHSSIKAVDVAILMKDLKPTNPQSAGDDWDSWD